MSIGAGIFIFIIGGLVGYMICMTSWVKELCREGNDIQMEIDRLKSEMRDEDGNNNQHN